jgi:hypothetical protein
MDMTRRVARTFVKRLGRDMAVRQRAQELAHFRKGALTFACGHFKVDLNVRKWELRPPRDGQCARRRTPGEDDRAKRSADELGILGALGAKLVGPPGLAGQPRGMGKGGHVRRPHGTDAL